MRKTKKIAWFVSNCKTESKREQLARQLKQYMPIDVYGNCGLLQCKRNINFTTLENDPCLKLLNNYKFYLSFENSLWDDYVTEKFFNAIQTFTIPIVYGGANYSKFAPPKSYINANDFTTVKELANYLHYLDANPDEYVKYFWWKNYYEIVVDTPMEKFCSLCKKLHEPNALKVQKIYHDLDGWWNDKAKKIIKPLIVF